MTSQINEALFVVGAEVLFLVGFFLGMYHTGDPKKGTTDYEFGMGFGCGLAVAGFLLVVAGALTWLVYHLKIT